MGNFPFLESRRMSLASERVTPSEAVTRVVVMMSARRADRGWNWTSREVTIPTSFPPNAPVSVVEKVSRRSSGHGRTRETSMNLYDGSPFHSYVRGVAAERRYKRRVHHIMNECGNRGLTS